MAEQAEAPELPRIKTVEYMRSIAPKVEGSAPPPQPAPAAGYARAPKAD